MNGLLIALLLPLHFTAPADSLGMDAMGHVHVAAVTAYVFQEVGSDGTLIVIPGYADSLGSAILMPQAPGTRQTAWLEPGPNGGAITVYLSSLDANGNMSSRSNGCVIGNRSVELPLATRRAAWSTLNVPLVKGTPERCGQTALAMVLRYYGAAPAALRELDVAYDPVLRCSRISDLAGAARRAGYEADVVTLTPDSLIDLLNQGVPPILLYENDAGTATFRQFDVLTGWDADNASFSLNDGTARRRVTCRREDLVKRWETAGSQALIVRERLP